MNYGNFAIWNAQIGILAAGAAALVALFRLRPAPARLVYWQVLLAVCLALPLLQPWQRELVVLAPVIETAVVMPVAALPSVPAPAPAPRRIPWPEVVAWVLAGGVVVRAGWFGLGLLRLSRYRRAALPLHPLPAPVAEACRRIGVYPEIGLSNDVSGPVTFGFRDPVVLFPARFPELDPEVQSAVACHELLHVRRRDWLFTAIEELLRALFWFHPAVWWMLGQIQLSREQSVDRQVVKLSEARERYVDALLALSGARGQLDLAPAPLFLRRRHLTARVSAILKEADMSYRRLILSLAACAGCLLVAGWLVCGSLPLKGAPQVISDAPGVKVTGAERIMHRSGIEYPPEARAKGIEGTVIVDAVLAPDGTVSDAAVISGPDELRKAALSAVLGWHFMKEAAPRQQVTVEFKLGRVVPPTTTQGGVIAGVIGPVNPDGTPAAVVMVKPQARTTEAAPPPPPPPPPPPLADGVKVVGVVPLRSIDMVFQPGGDLRKPEVLKRIMINLPQDKADELRRRLPVQEGQIVDNEMLNRAQQVIKDFDPKLTASLFHMRTTPAGAQPGDGLALSISPLPDSNALSKVPQKLVGVSIQGLSPEAEAELRRRLAVREGAVFSREEMTEEVRRVSEIAREFDPHLKVGPAARAVRKPGPDGTITLPDAMEVRIGIFPEGYGLQQFAQVGAAPLPEPPPGVQRIRVGGAVQASKLTNQVRPFYPPEAKEIRLSGMVRMNILVAREGNILNITVISGHPLLVPAAMEAVKQWRYSPTLLNGVPVEVVTEADVNFTLSQ